MPSRNQQPIFSNHDAEIIVVDETVGVIDTTHRPASGASLKMAQMQLEKEAEFRKLMDQMQATAETAENRAQLEAAPVSELERRFDAAMLNIYRRAKSEAKYTATRYFQMLADHGGLETARILLHANSISDGYTALWTRGRLDLTVEALIHDQAEYHELFTDEERELARKRLEEYRYPPVIGPR
jgi:hypothetical protein